MTPPPPPPPPPPAEPPSAGAGAAAPHPPPGSSTSIAPTPEISAVLSASATQLETNRCYRTELESSLIFAANLLSHPEGLSVDQAKTLPGGVRDAFHAVGDGCRPLKGDDVDVLGVDAASAVATAAGLQQLDTAVKKEKDEHGMEVIITPGQIGKAAREVALATAIDRAVSVSKRIEEGKRRDENETKLTRNLLTLVQQADSSAAAAAATSNNATDNEQGDASNQSRGSTALLLDAFYSRLSEVREYHAKNEQSESSAAVASAAPDISGGLAPMDIVDTTTNIGNNNAANKDYEGDNTGGNLDQESRERILQLTQGVGKRRKVRHGNPHADGYDLHSIILSEVARVRGGELFSPEEMFGKYLDLGDVHDGLVVGGTLRMELAKKAAAVAASAGREGQSSSPSSPQGEEKKDESTPSSSSSSLPYVDFLSLLTQPIATLLPEPTKLNNRKHYVRFLSSLFDYLTRFLHRTMPLLNVDREVIRPALDEFEQEWSETGGFDGWDKRDAERILAFASASASEHKPGDEKKAVTVAAPVEAIDLAPYSTPQALCDAVDADTLKAELSRMGLKCGGAPLDRAKRLFLTKDTPLAKLPKKVWAKGRGPPVAAPAPSSSDPAAAETKDTEASKDGNTANQASTPSSSPITSAFFAGSSRRVDVARLEVVTQSLIDQLRPTLDATVRRAERRLYQTPNEREVELDEEINGVAGVKSLIKDEKKEKGEGYDSDEDSDEEDAPIYNPKGVPLGWDGKPIPYWLFKLHGLNHFYSCEICGNESYRGRHNFEKHFQEPKHMYGMRCLGIPNTRHFHGVTKIEDAQRLWDKLQQTVEGSVFDGEKEEEYEDNSHGNVLTRKTYEDLARQGLL